MIGARLPNVERASVSQHKLTGYLLSEAHPDGRGNAVFFTRYGFSAGRSQDLAAALLRHAGEHKVVGEVETAFGTRYVIEGALRAPDGRSPWVRSVWFISQPGGDPAFVTAYPMKRSFGP